MPLRYTFNAKDAIEQAREEASRSGAGRLGTEHLLIAVAEGAAGELRAALWEVGARPDLLRETLAGLYRQALRAVGVELDPSPLPAVVPNRMPFTEGAKDAFHEMILIAADRGVRVIEPQHLLAALCQRSENDQATILLRASGVDPFHLAALALPPDRKTA